MGWGYSSSSRSNEEGVPGKHWFSAVVLTPSPDSRQFWVIHKPAEFPRPFGVGTRFNYRNPENEPTANSSAAGQLTPGVGNHYGTSCNGDRCHQSSFPPKSRGIPAPPSDPHGDQLLLMAPSFFSAFLISFGSLCSAHMAGAGEEEKERRKAK